MPKRSTESFENELKVNLRLLAKSCAEFDRGDLDEFRNIARALRLIFTPDVQNRGLSLIELAGNAEIELIDTGSYAHRLSLGPEFALVAIVAGTRTAGCRAPLNIAPQKRPVDLQFWLDGYPIVRDPEGKDYTRLALIKAVANLAGSTHYPEDVRAHFLRLQGISVDGMRFGIPTNLKHRDFEKHSLRQIAFEVLYSLGGHSPNIVADDDALIMMGQEFLLYPGRRTNVSVLLRQNGHKPGKIRPPAGVGLKGMMVKLPYEDTLPSAPCPCHSDLSFQDCCMTAREFPPAFIDTFERKFGLGAYRPEDACRRPGQ